MRPQGHADCCRACQPNVAGDDPDHGRHVEHSQRLNRDHEPLHRGGLCQDLLFEDRRRRHRACDLGWSDRWGDAVGCQWSRDHPGEPCGAELVSRVQRGQLSVCPGHWLQSGLQPHLRFRHNTVGRDGYGPAISPRQYGAT